MANQKTILIVEDEISLQEALKLKFEKAGLRVLVARTAEDAFLILKKETPDIVTLDILLPGMNGIELLRGIRADERWKDLKIVIVSISGGPEKIKQAFGLNVVDFLVKSEHTLEGLVEKVKGYAEKT